MVLPKKLAHVELSRSRDLLHPGRRLGLLESNIQGLLYELLELGVSRHEVRLAVHLHEGAVGSFHAQTDQAWRKHVSTRKDTRPL